MQISTTSVQSSTPVQSTGRGAMHPAIEDAAARYAARNPTSRAMYESAQASMPGGNTRSALHFDPFPLYIERSDGPFLFDVDGHEYLDLLGEFTAGLYGHNDSRIQKAVVGAINTGISNGAPGANEIRMADLICSRFPSIDKVRFCNSGTEANLYAMTLARIVTGRQKFLCFSGAYHGGVFVFAGGGNQMNVPFEWTVCRYNDEAATAQAIDELGGELAAVIVEPMMCNGGGIAATPSFLRMLRERTSANGALLIFDEVVTSRMSGGGMQQIHGVMPDLTTLGKYLGAGFSFGAFGGRAELLDRMNPTRPDALPHAGTFNNNVFTMSAGVTALSEIFTPARADELFRTGEALRIRLNTMARKIVPGVQFTGCGSVMNIHFCGHEIQCPEDLATESKELVQLFHFDLMEREIYPARRGQFTLSLPMEQTHIESVVNGIEAFLTERAILIEALTRPQQS